MKLRIDMKVFVEGVEIELTKEQLAKVEKRRKQIESDFRSFKSVLRHFGFKQLKDQKDCFANDKWYAEIVNHGNWHSVWMTGQGLKNSHLFPGGWTYFEPNEIRDELYNAAKDF